MAMAIARARRARGWRQGPGPRGTVGAGLSMIATPTIGTMFLSGLWHGAGPQYLVFGLLHGGYLTTNHFWRLYRPRFWPDAAGHALNYNRVMRPIGLVLTLVAASVALTYFRADTVRAGNDIVAGMTGLHGVALPDVIQSRLQPLAAILGRLGVAFEPRPLPDLLAMLAWIAALLAIALVPPNVLQMMYRTEPAITLPLPYGTDPRIAPFRRLFTPLAWQPSAGWAVAAGVVSLSGILALNHVTAFLYWQF